MAITTATDPTERCCPKCGGVLLRRNGRNGAFYGCSRFPDCRHTENLEKDEKAEEIEKTKDDDGFPVCPKCGSTEMIIRESRYGFFWACPKFPACKGVVKYQTGKSAAKVDPANIYPAKPDEPLDEKCHACGKNFVKRHGPYGEFICCCDYPKCKTIKREIIGAPCPLCGGDLTPRKGKEYHSKSVFYGCTNYPRCKFISKDKPVPKKCPRCRSPYLVEKVSKAKGKKPVAFLKCPNEKCDFEEITE